DVANSQLGQTIAKSFTHNPSASTVSIGSGKYYTVVGEQMNWTYFSTSTRAWKVFQNLPSHIFDGVNTAFMQQQMSQGKEFVSSISDFPGRGYLMEKSLLHLWGYIENVVVKQSTIFRLPK
ncbi:MAG: hypothetical protein GXY34_13500, partial [Syntrophomonadaceae bacterium]|nr:hypothetical protein [Syntrophomonadaceae bacterium]